jgi:asparagine synthase (glutamine-hydrolysing)
VRALLDESIRLHLVSDVPVGVFLSGGIDSSAIVALMRAGGMTPHTFSVGVADPAYDESRYASAVAERFGAEHSHIPLTEDELLSELPDAIGAMDHPTGDGVNSYVVSKAVRQAGVKVALSGLGGDELFGGYPSFARFARFEGPLARWGAAPKAARGAAAGLVRAVGGSVATAKAAEVLESDGSLAEAWPITRQLLSPADRRVLLDPSWTARARTDDPYAERLSAAYEAAPGAGLWSRVSYAEASAYMHDVLLRDVDQMSMAHGLEVRVPLLDHRLVEYVIGLPDACKRIGSGPKPLLVQALGGVLPEDVVSRPKRGFTLPFDPWMRSALRDFCERRLGPQGLAGRGLFSAPALARLWASFLAGSRETTWSRVWMLVVLEAWLDRHGIEAEAVS